MQEKIAVMHLINGYLLAGAEKLVFDLVAGTDRERFDVSVCSVGIVRDRLEEEVYNNLKGNGVKTLVLGKPSGKRRFETVRKLRQHLVNNNITILHTHCPSPDFYGKISALIARTPLVFSTIHSINGYNAIHERILSTLTTKYIAISETVKRYAISDLNIPPVKIDVIRNAVDYQRFSRIVVDKGAKLRELGVPAGKKIISTVGILREVKGHRYLIKAAGQVIKKFPDTHFLVVGDTSADPDFADVLRGMINSGGLHGHISLTGKRSDVTEILAISDMFVLPSLWEGLSIALLEAMAAGLPVIASNVGSNPEVVTDGINGFIVPARDPRLLARRIEELLGEPGKADDMGMRARETVRESFGMDRAVRAHEELYLKHLGALRGRRRSKRTASWK